MKIRRLVLCSGAIACSLVVGRPSTAQVPPPPPTPTIWNFLGIPGTTEKIRNQLLNRRGNRPGLEKKPPIKAIGDPANLMAPSLPIRTAAEIKQQEDLKLQKIKGIKYLASVGCGCYDKDGGKVTEAMLAAMNDCTEEVRLAAVESIAVAAMSERCVTCKQKSCCNEKIAEQLAKLAYQYDDTGCFVEPSERVREAAIATLQVCCPGGPPPITPPTVEQDEVEGAEEDKVEGADEDTSPRPLEDEAPAPPKLDTTLLRPLPNGSKSSRQPASSRRGQAARTIATEGDLAGSALTGNFNDSVSMFASNRLSDENDPIGRPTSIRAESPPAPVENVAPKSAAPVINVSATTVAPSHHGMHNHLRGTVAGAVEHVNTSSGVVHLHVEDGVQLPVGSKIRVLHELIAGIGKETDLEVFQSAPGMANARPKYSGKPAVIARGDRIISAR